MIFMTRIGPARQLQRVAERWSAGYPGAGYFEEQNEGEVPCRRIASREILPPRSTRSFALWEL